MRVEEVESGKKVPEGASGYHSYPPPLATYEDVVKSPDLFMDTLKKLHICMGTKFMIPIVGGRDLDLHRLFVEVTSRGGIAKVMSDKNWKEVTGVFNFPSSATNASFILRKYYVSLIYHYEQIYFFQAKCWSPSPSLQGGMQNLSTLMAPPPKLATAQTTPPQVSSSSSPPVCGVIDGKFESGYLITVKIGCDEFKGVLYQVPNAAAAPDSVSLKPAAASMPRRKRRKKSEMRKRDPAHPKPNRSGYNFFFAEQHARLKPHYHGRDREISRIIGESWNKLQEPERRVYQEKALKDKERYKTEMEVYRERLRTGEITPTTTTIPVPIQLYPPVPQLATDLNSSSNVVFEDNEMSSDKSYNEDKESGCSQADTQLKNVNIEVMSDAAFDLQTRVDDDMDEDRKALLVEVAPSNADESVASLEV